MNSNSIFNQKSRALKEKLREVVKNYDFDGSLLSGGLDTSIINYIAAVKNPNLNCITVGFENSKMKDIRFARILAEKLEIKNHHIYTFDFEKAKKTAEKTVKIMKSFDPIEIRNDISLLIALKKAKEKGAKTILTGDGSDELLAGYSYIYKKSPEKIGKEIKKIRNIMTFSSQKIAKDLGIKVKIPFLNEKIKKFTKNLKPEYLVGEKNGKKYGKWILRKAYENNIPSEIIWREKTPIEMGSGTTKLKKMFKSQISEKRFESEREKIKKEDEVTLRSEEQLYYYKIFKRHFGIPKPENPEDEKCPYCGVNVSSDATFCRICGNGLEGDSL